MSGVWLAENLKVMACVEDELCHINKKKNKKKMRLSAWRSTPPPCDFRKLGKVSSLSLVAVIRARSVNLARDISGFPKRNKRLVAEARLSWCTERTKWRCHGARRADTEAFASRYKHAKQRCFPASHPPLRRRLD